RKHAQAQVLENKPVIRIDRLASGSKSASWRRVGERPLSGLKVLDLSHILAGPGVARTLAEQGADVLRISAPTQTDPLNFVLDTGFGKRHAFLDFNRPDDVDRA